ncbi:MAG: MFS transporter [Deltaproteobacteria bacterium]|nr:MFS transporter [Deltaproteobacteria bacterium]
MNVAGTSQGRIPFGWWVVTAAFLIMAVTVGAFYSYGVFFLPVLTEFGWGRGLASGVVLFSALVYAAAVAPAGWLADRYGFRILCASTAGLLGLGLVLCSQIRTVWHLYLFGGLLTGLGAPVSVALPLSVVARWFTKNQGLALAAASTGIGAGTALVPLLAAYLMEHLGWRTSYAVIGVLVWAVAVPSALLAMRRPKSGEVPGQNAEARTIPGQIAPTDHYSLSRALGTGFAFSPWV